MNICAVSPATGEGAALFRTRRIGTLLRFISSADSTKRILMTENINSFALKVALRSLVRFTFEAPEPGAPGDVVAALRELPTPRPCVTFRPE